VPLIVSAVSTISIGSRWFSSGTTTSPPPRMP
jgi:hypothetical protein